MSMSDEEDRADEMRERLDRQRQAAEPAEWTCGHVAGAACAECYRILAWKAHQLQEEVDRLRDELDKVRRG